MKSFLSVYVTMNDGSTFINPLKLSEVYLINQITKKHEKVEVRRITTDEAHYKSLFG